MSSSGGPSPAPQESDVLAAGHNSIRAERGCRCVGGDSVLHGPLHHIVVVGIRRYISEGVRTMGSRELALLNDESLQKLDEYKMDLIASGRYRPIQKRRMETYIEMMVSTLAVSAGTGEILDEGQFERIHFLKSAVLVETAWSRLP